ncbi:MAG: tetratricopeptide repeat protein [Thermoanaerobaculia bacterium]|nr:tetratricopeptide repeat protein [Thermoanaerobaculia bacterium]
MSRSGGNPPAASGFLRPQGVLSLVLWILPGLLATPPPLGAQLDTAPREGVTLSRSVSQVLAHLQDDWIGWMNSYFQNQPEVAEEHLRDLLSSLDVLGFERLPELSTGATVRGVEAAFQGSPERAEFAFDAAERLDPGRPEIELGRAILARETGDRLGAVIHQLRAIQRLFGIQSYRFLWWRNLLLGILAVVLLAGAFFTVTLLARLGPPLMSAIRKNLQGRIPGPMGHLGAAVILLWPLVLPHGVAWALLYWSVLLWAVASRSQRVVLGLVWIVLGATPLLLSMQLRQVQVALSPPSRAIDAMEEDRLYGTFFSDLGVLATLLPEHPGVLELLGDVHRTLGQWEEALPFYRAVLEQDPDDRTSLISVGAYYFRKGDYGNAIRFFQRAANLEDATAAAYYNLSQAYSESYLFDEQKQALRRARELGEEQVSRWIEERSEERVVTFQGGLGAEEAIRSALVSSWSRQEDSRKVRPFLSLVLPVLGLAFGLALRRGLEGSLPRRDPFPDRGTGMRMVRTFVPGLTSAEEGRGGQGFLAALVPAALLLIAAPGRVGFDLPWGLAPNRGAIVACVFASLVIFLGIRLVRAVRG